MGSRESLRYDLWRATEELYTIEDWCNKFQIHKKINSKLNEIGIKYLYGYYSDEIRKGKYGKEFYIFAGYLKKPMDLEKESTCIFYLLGQTITPRRLQDILTYLKNTNEIDKSYIIININRKECLNIISEEYNVINKYKTGKIERERNRYNRNRLYKRLKTVIDNVINLPLQPNIFGYGSFFREKENVDDIDLAIEFTPLDSERIKRFQDYFPADYYQHKGDPRVELLYKFMHLLEDEMIFGTPLKILSQMKNDELEKIRFSNNLQKRIKFQKYCDIHPEIRTVIQKGFDLDYDLLYYCTWTEVTGNNWYRQGIHHIYEIKMFERMFSKSLKGFTIQPKDEKFNYILLWSKEKSIFEKNYKDWEQNKLDYIKMEYIHFVNEISEKIERHEKNLPYQDEEKNNICLNVINGLKQLKTKFFPIIEKNDNYSTLSKKCNEIRSRTKEIEKDWLEKTHGFF